MATMASCVFHCRRFCCPSFARHLRFKLTCCQSAVLRPAHRPPSDESGKCFRIARIVSCIRQDCRMAALRGSRPAFRLSGNRRQRSFSHRFRMLRQSRYGRIWSTRVSGNIDRVRPWSVLCLATGSNRAAAVQYCCHLIARFTPSCFQTRSAFYRLQIPFINHLVTPSL